MDRKVMGAILIGVALVVFFIGYQMSQPSMLESVGAMFGAKTSHSTRGIPLYILGIAAGIGGLKLLTGNKGQD